MTKSRPRFRVGGSLLGFLLSSYLALAVAPVALFGLLGAVLLSSAYRADVRNATTVSMRSAVAEAGRYVAGPQRLVESLSLLFRAPGAKEQAGMFLDAAQRGASGIRSVMLLDAARRVVAAAPEGAAAPGTDFSRRSFMREAEAGKTRLSTPFVDPATDGVEAAAVRIEEDRAVVAVLELDTLSAFLRPLRFSTEDQVAIVDEDGVYIAHTEERRVHERQRENLHAELRSSVGGTPRRIVRDGRSYLAAGSPIPSTDWTVVYYRDLEAASSLSIAFIYRFAALIGALVIAAAVFVYLARRAFASRLDELLGRIREVERGSWFATATASDSWKEFREIGEAFGHMAERVAEREEDMRRSEEKYRGLFVWNKAPTLIIDGETGRIVDSNPAAASFYGYPRDRLLDMNIYDINTLSRADIAAEMAAAEEERRNHFHFRHRLADGEIRDVEVYSSPVEWEGERRLYSSVIDVTERRLAEERVARSLAEKEVLLREVHHRVKNNLQIMASLLSLQSLYVRDEADAELFRSSQDRILSMAAIHELLYQREDLAAVDLGEYLASLVGNLSETAERAGIEIIVRAEAAAVTPEKALPLGLIVNELITNSVKYAFPRPADGPEAPAVFVTLTRDGLSLELEVRDNGIGLPPGVDPAAAQSLGFSLVRSLSAQLGGSVAFTRSDGFAVRLRAPFAL